MLLESFCVEHLILKPLLKYKKYKWKYAGALKFMNEIPLNTYSYYVTALETEVATFECRQYTNLLYFCFEFQFMFV